MSTATTTPTNAHNAATYLQEREGFSYPKFAREHGLSTPDGFWSFWVHYYQSPKERRDQLRRVENFTQWSELLWRIFEQAEGEIKRKSAAMSSVSSSSKEKNA